MSSAEGASPGSAATTVARAAGELSRHRRAEIGVDELPAIGLAADPDGDQPLGRKPGRGRNGQRRRGLALEALGAGGAGDRILDPRLDLERRVGGLQVVADEDHEVAAGGRAEGLEIDLHARCHRAFFRLIAAPEGRDGAPGWGVREVWLSAHI